MLVVLREGPAKSFSLGNLNLMDPAVVTRILQKFFDLSELYAGAPLFVDFGQDLFWGQRGRVNATTGAGEPRFPDLFEGLGDFLAGYSDAFAMPAPPTSRDLAQGFCERVDVGVVETFNGLHEVGRNGIVWEVPSVTADDSFPVAWGVDMRSWNRASLP